MSKPPKLLAFRHLFTGGKGPLLIIYKWRFQGHDCFTHDWRGSGIAHIEEIQVLYDFWWSKREQGLCDYIADHLGRSSHSNPSEFWNNAP